MITVLDVQHYFHSCSEIILPCDDILGRVDDLMAGLVGFESAILVAMKKANKYKHMLVSDNNSLCSINYYSFHLENIYNKLSDEQKC